MRVKISMVLTALVLLALSASGCMQGVQGLLPDSLEFADLSAERENENIVRVTGSVKNHSNRTVEEIVVTVWLEDESGNTIPDTESQEQIDFLRPDQKKAFPDIRIAYEGEWEHVKAHLGQ